MNCKPLNTLIEKLKVGYLFRIIHGAYCNMRYPEYDLYGALALKRDYPEAMYSSLRQTDRR